jgi:hypothetical protein
VTDFNAPASKAAVAQMQDEDVRRHLHKFATWLCQSEDDAKDLVERPHARVRSQGQAVGPGQVQLHCAHAGRHERLGARSATQRPGAIRGPRGGRSCFRRPNARPPAARRRSAPRGARAGGIGPRHLSRISDFGIRLGPRHRTPSLSRSQTHDANRAPLALGVALCAPSARLPNRSEYTRLNSAPYKRTRLAT